MIDADQPAPRIKAQYFLLKLDETRYWADAVAARAGRILGLYVFNKHRRFHLCEFTPSYECLFVGSLRESGDLAADEADRLDDDIREGDLATDTIRYFHCHEIEALALIGDHNLQVGVSDLGIEDEQEALEFVRQRVL